MEGDSGLYILGYIIIAIIYKLNKVEKNCLKQRSNMNGA